MNAVEYLKQNVDILFLLKYYNANKINESSNEIRCACPIHGGDNPSAFVFNKRNGLWFCHTGTCGGGDIYDFVMKKDELDFISSVKRISEIFNVDISTMEITIRANEIMRDTQDWIQTMRGLLKKEFETFDITQLGELYGLNSYRQFTKETLDVFNIKYCKDNNRYVVPIYFKNQCVGVTMRCLGNHPIKWMHQPRGLETSNMLFNYDNIKQCEPLIICEGVFDVLNYYQNGYKNVVATFGSHMSESQKHLITAITYDIIIAYDNDAAGIKGTHQVINLLQQMCNIKIAEIPITKDPGQLTSEEIKTSLENQKTINMWRELNG